MADDDLKEDPFDLTGRTFSHYQVLRRIGSGGVGWVYEAEDPRLGRRVALKILQPWSRFDGKARERFEQEARAASSLAHTNTCTVFEFDEFDGHPYLTMELVDGSSLQETVNAGPVDPEIAAAIVHQMAKGLAHAHARGVVHRDIKPGNVLVDGDGQVKIADFGLARTVDAATVTQTGTTVGTVAYMSPEQATGGAVGATSDIWSLGIVYFELLMGKRPFQGEYASAVLYQIVHGHPERMEELRSRFGNETADLIAACLSRSPDERPSASAVAARLTPSEPSESVDRGLVGRRPLILSLGAAALLAAIVIIVMWTIDAGPAETPPDLTQTSIAILPPDAADRELGSSLTALVAATSEVASQLGREYGLVGHVVPYDSLARHSSFSFESAAAGFGVSHVIQYDLIGDDTALRLALHTGNPASPVAEERIPLSPDGLHETFDAAVRATARLLGLPDSDHPDIPNPYGPLEPQAFDLYARAMGLIEGQESREAILAGIDMLERARERTPEFAPIYAGLAKGYLYLFDRVRDPDLLETADRHCDRAIELDQSLTDAYITYSQIHIKTGRPGMARQILNLAGERGAETVEALLALADIHASQGNHEEAEAAYRRALNLGSGYWDVYRRAGNYYFYRSKYDLAAEQYEHLVELAPLNSKSYLNLGAAHFYQGNLDLADRYWQDGMDINPNDHQLFMNAGALYYYVGRYDRAAEALERAVALNEADYIVWGNLGTAYLWSGADRDLYEATKRMAIDLATETLDANPDDNQARAKLAGYHAEMGDTTAAFTQLDYFGRSPSQSYPNETLFEVGTAWEAVGERTPAIEWISKAVYNGYSVTELERYPGLAELRDDSVFADFLDDVLADRSSSPQDR